MLFYDRMMSKEVEKEKEVMVEAKGWDEDWEETHVVKLRWLETCIPDNESSFCSSKNVSHLWRSKIDFQGWRQRSRRRVWGKECEEDFHNYLKSAEEEQRWTEQSEVKIIYIVVHYLVYHIITQVI